MKNLNAIAEQLFNKVRGRFPSITIGDAEGNVTDEPSLARFFDFSFESAGNKLGKVSISLDEEDGLVLMFSKDFIDEAAENAKDNWYDFLKDMRVFSKKRLLKFEVRDLNRSNLTKRDYSYLAKNRRGEELMAESKMYGNEKTSFQKFGKAKIAIKHHTPINVENIQNRTKNIGSIFIESPEGEKFKFPFKHLNGARALAKHISEGGHAYDDFGKYITSLSEEWHKLRKFKNYMNRSTVMAESLAGYNDAINARIKEVKETISNLRKDTFYKTALENFVPSDRTEVPEDVASNWIDQLTIKQFNEELKDVFPYIYNLVSESTKAKELSFEDLLREADTDEEMYKVQQGDTLYDIGRRRGVPEDQLQGFTDDVIEINGLTGDNIAPGQELRLPPQQIGASPSGSGATRGIDPIDNYGDDYKKLTMEQQVDAAFDNLLGQFADNFSAQVEGDQGDMDRDGKDEPDDKEWKDARHAAIAKAMGAPEEVDEERTPLGEFILSYFDRQTGKFPKGETAVLTAVEKDYGEQYVRPANKFIERLGSAFEQFIIQKNAGMLEGSFDDFGLKDYGSELDRDDTGDNGFSGQTMFVQLGKVLDSANNPNPVTTVTTDDGEEVAVTPEQARMLRMMLSAEGMKPNVKLRFTKDIQRSSTLHDFVDVKDYHEMPKIFMQKYM